MSESFQKKKNQGISKAANIPRDNWDPLKTDKSFLPGIWNDEEIEELSIYCDWHKNHPHCISPRLINEKNMEVAGDRIIDENNPNYFYTRAVIQEKPLPPELAVPPIGHECDTDEVSTIALKVEYDKFLGKKDAEDPWYEMSVKDQLEQFHIDGSHTTVKTKRAKKAQLSEFEKDLEWRAHQYGDYAGGYPKITQKHLDALEQLALGDKFHLHDEKKKKKLNPWNESYEFSIFTKDGSALNAYKKAALEKNINEALFEFEQQTRKMTQSHKTGKKDGNVVNDDSMSIRSSRSGHSGRSAKSSRSGRTSRSGRSSRSRKKRKRQVFPLDPYDMMKEKLGGAKKISSITKELVSVAQKAAKKAKKKQKVVDTTVDLVEACDKLRVIKAMTILMMEDSDPDMKTLDDEPIFTHMIKKILKFDSSTLSTEADGDVSDTSERKRAQKILDLLIKYKVDVNTQEGKEQIAPIHYAVMAENTRVIRWLFEKKASVDIFSKRDNLTPLMYAAKYGLVKVAAELIKNGASVNMTNLKGQTALHICALFGQTRSAQFLLRLGALKYLKDEDNKTPAQIAIEKDYQSTAQTISSYAVLKPDIEMQLKYTAQQDDLSEQQRRSRQGKKKKKKSKESSRFFTRVANVVSSYVGRVKNFFKRKLLELQGESPNLVESDDEDEMEDLSQLDIMDYSEGSIGDSIPGEDGPEYEQKNAVKDFHTGKPL